MWPPPPDVPGAGPSTGMSNAPFQQRDAALQRAKNAQARVYRICGFLTVNGAGSTLQPVKFPLRFTEMPSMSFGWSLMEGQQLQTGAYPIVSVGVGRWTLEDHPMAIRYYAGAELAISASGRSDQRLIIHWQAEGQTVGTLGSSADQSADGAV
jgi:hypothetical protein